MAAEPVNVNEFQELARQALPKMYYDFFAGGAEDQHTLRENVEAFSRITFQPRILVDVSKIDMSTTILGYKISSPIMIAPTSLQKLAHPEGEIATARAAAASNTIMVLVCYPLWLPALWKRLLPAATLVRFLQLYVFKRRDISAQVVQKAERYGFKAIVLTVDTPRLGRREADIKNRMVSPQLKNFEGLLTTDVSNDKGSSLEALASEIYDASLSWKDIEWLRSITNLPILIKGVLTCEDGCGSRSFWIIVSNHGARQLDYVPAAISALEEVILFFCLYGVALFCRYSA
ncbi:Peroxisomal (S)-2-hydroxy-acid oxidase GLO4 [Vitis vinifera]|uniref:(S)-2-hydroxy-acid oxidase n=1 Tax=Vitis vinifera TaxID=29760 RepID=A0A438K6M6_VITVI|nr:Peroxisomal (S)-2-hydroxy-acid oxidase GLO4 [Vitis vinifera]